MFYLLFLSAVSFFTLQADFLDLPRSYSYKAVYHIKVRQLDEFCCGYNALFNACNFEKSSEIHQPYSDYASFKGLCMSYLSTQGLHPKSSVSNETLNILAGKEYLNLQPTCFLQFNKEKKVVPYIATPTEIVHDARLSKQEVKRMLNEAHGRREQEVLKKIQTRLATSNARCEVIHFICSIDVVKGKGHAVLITLTQNRNGRALYIFDNLNAKIDERSQTKRFIDFLCSTFTISPRQTFKGPHLPNAWQTIPKRTRTWDEEYEQLS